MSTHDTLPMPCPFCGESPEVQHWHGGSPEKRLIGCINEDCYASPSVTGETLESATARWNQRATPRGVAELIAEAKRAEYLLRDMAEAGFGDPRQADGLRITLAGVVGAV